MPAPTLLYDLGRMGYREAWGLQAQIQARLIEAKRVGTSESVPHALLIVEHPPVFTLGKSGDPSHLLADERQLLERGADYVETDRGGDITFHGPGQLVVYPVLDLDRLANPEGEPLRDLHRYLRELEEAVIRTCAAWNVGAGRVRGRTGVWVGPDPDGEERKICAMGVRCSRWVTMHGLALNVTTDLSWFDLIVPCGIDDRSVTSLAREVGEPVERSAIARTLVSHLADRLGLVVRLAEAEALEAPGVPGKISASTP